MVSSFGFGKENMDLVEKSIGKTVLIKFVLHGQLAAIEGRLYEVSPFDHVSLDRIEIFSIIESKKKLASKREVTLIIAEITAANKIEIPFVGNNSAIRRISVVKIEEQEVDEKTKDKEEKIKRERSVALLILKIERKQELNKEDEILLKSITENRDKKFFALKEETLYYNMWIPDCYYCLKDVEQIQRFKKALWGEYTMENDAEAKKETLDKFTKFWYE